jgi:hypothetical protein
MCDDDEKRRVHTLSVDNHTQCAGSLLKLEKIKRNLFSFSACVCVIGNSPSSMQFLWNGALSGAI